MYIEGDVPYVANGNCGNYNNNGWSNDWSWIIGLIAVAGLFGGGFGGGLFGNRGGSCATQADLAAGFNNSAVLNSLNDIKLGQAQAINYNNQGFAGLNTAILQGYRKLLQCYLHGAVSCDRGVFCQIYGDVSIFNREKFETIK